MAIWEEIRPRRWQSQVRCSNFGASHEVTNVRTDEIKASELAQGKGAEDPHINIVNPVDII